MRSKFKGKYLEVEPLGIAHLYFPKSGNHYTWRKVKTVVHNIVIGKLWIDQHGEMSVINHAKDIKCHMKFEPYSYFGGTPKKVTGSVVNEREKVSTVEILCPEPLDITSLSSGRMGAERDLGHQVRSL